MNALRALLLAFLATLAFGGAPAAAQREEAPRGLVGEIRIDDLPKEARSTLELIRRKGPFPYARDGAVFANREGHLPWQKRGYYREYTVKTPGVRTRGARRIVAGAGGEFYYTEDHYNRFRRIRH